MGLAAANHEQQGANYPYAQQVDTHEVINPIFRSGCNRHENQCRAYDCGTCEDLCAKPGAWFACQEKSDHPWPTDQDKYGHSHQAFHAGKIAKLHCGRACQCTHDEQRAQQQRQDYDETRVSHWWLAGLLLVAVLLGLDQITNLVHERQGRHQSAVQVVVAPLAVPTVPWMVGCGKSCEACQIVRIRLCGTLVPTLLALEPMNQQGLHFAASTFTRGFGHSPNISGAYIASTREGGSAMSPTLFSRTVYSIFTTPLGRYS